MKQHKERKLNRLRNFDYSSQRFYFITICTHNKETWFGEIDDNKMLLNKYGKFIKNRWLWLKENFRYVVLDEFIIMPNHLHGLIFMKKDNMDSQKNEGRTKTLSGIIGAFKTTSSKILHENGLPEFRWQKSFYDHIVRDVRYIKNIRNYIRNNPASWNTDIENKLCFKRNAPDYYEKVLSGE